MEKFKLIRKEYPGTQNQTYLDTATTGLLSNASYEAMKERLDTRNLKGLKMSEYFSDWNHADEMRKLVAQMINAEKEEVFYGKDCSEILNAIASNIEIPIGSNVVTANISFPSTRNAWLNREKDGLEVRFVEAQNGAIPFESIKEAVDEKTIAISVCYVEPSSGFKYNLYKLGELCKENDILLVVDATQCISAMEVDVKSMHIDFLAASTYKWMTNVFGIGIGFMTKNLLDKIHPKVVGWVGVEDRNKDFAKMTFKNNQGAQRFETGGLNWLGLLGLEKAIENYLFLGKSDIETYILELVDYVYEEVKQYDGIDIVERFSKENRSNIIYLKFPQSYRLNDEMLNENGIRAHVASKDSIRIGIHFYNNKDDIDALLNFFNSVQENINPIT